MRIVVGITGASGIIYATRLLEVLKENKVTTYCIVSDVAKRIAEYELKPGGTARFSECYGEKDVDAPFASGSFKIDAMVVVPCSMKTLSAIANGFSMNLIARAADVVLKEGRRLVLVPRETPLNSIHLRNMMKLSELGVTILPAMPGFYHKPKKIEDMVDFIVGKVLDSLGIENNLYKRWGR